MWISAGTLRLRTALLHPQPRPTRPRVAPPWLAVACGFWLAGCADPGAAPQVLMMRCLDMGAGQGAAVQIRTPSAGLLAVRVRERGISVVGRIDGLAGTDSESPLEREGMLVLTVPTVSGQKHEIQLRPQDSPDIRGEVCVAAELLPASGGATVVTRISADQAFAAAGRAAHNKDWDAALDGYVSAARDFDGLSLRGMSGAARHALAELVYRRFDRKRDSYALASQARADYRAAEASQRFAGPHAAAYSQAATGRGPGIDPVLFGLLATLQGKALLDMPGRDMKVAAPRIRELFAAARGDYSASRFDARELPRLDIMTGFLEYILDNPDAPARVQAIFAGAAQTCAELRDWDCYAAANQNLAVLAAESKNNATALAAYDNALRRLPPEVNPKLAADIWNNYGRLQGVVGLYSASARSHATAIRAYAQLGDCPGVRRSLSYAGSLMVQIGTLSDAEDYLQQAASSGCTDLLAALDTPSGDPPGASGLPTDTDRRYTTSGSEHDARARLCSQALDASSMGVDNKMIVFNSLLSLGDALVLEGESHQAQRCVDQAERYAATARSQMRLANARGILLLDAADAAGARLAFEHSLQVADEAKIPDKYEYRGSAQIGLVRSTLLAGSGPQALLAGQRALQASVGRGDIDQTVTSLRLIAMAYRETGQAEAAAQTLQTAADLIEAVPIDELDGAQRATYLATQFSVFAELTDLFASQATDNPAMAWQAFATSERGRARSLRYAVTQATRNASSPLAALPAQRYQDLLREVVGLSEAAPAGGPQDLVAQLGQAALRQRQAEPPIDRNPLLHTLGQLDATLVAYALGSHDLFAFVIRPDRTEVVRLGARADIASAAAELQRRLRDPEGAASEVRQSAAQLARLVLWPLVPYLTGKRIILVPDDALHTVPLNVLPWSDSPADRLVLHHAEVSVVPSALFLTRLRRQSAPRESAPRIELIGDPVFRQADWRRECAGPAGKAAANTAPTPVLAEWTESLPRLPGSRAEVQMVAQLARQSRPGSHVASYLGCAAVPGALRQAASERVELLHIATHARVDAQRPRLSALALSPTSSTDPASTFGLLDILGLKLNSGLVVLSACDTSRGRLLPGEGVLGPAQAFLQAGAASVLASYWRVDDQATARFMQQFYGYLLTGHMPAATALRRAQLDRAEDSSAHDWAAFALYGWPDSSI